MEDGYELRLQKTIVLLVLLLICGRANAYQNMVRDPETALDCLVITQASCEHEGYPAYCTRYVNHCPFRVEAFIDLEEGPKLQVFGPQYFDDRFPGIFDVGSAVTVICGTTPCGNLVSVGELPDPSAQENWILYERQSLDLVFERAGERISRVEDIRIGDIVRPLGKRRVYREPNKEGLGEWFVDQNQLLVVEKFQPGAADRLEFGTWVEVGLAPSNDPAAMPSAPPSEGGNGSPPRRQTEDSNVNGIWWEYPVAEATGGYDPDANRTLINSYNLVVFGPSRVESAIVQMVETCVKLSATTAYKAFKSTPSPELAGRIGAAWTAFHVGLRTCFEVKSISQGLRDRFDLGYIRRGKWVAGLRLKFTAENPTTEQYRQMHNLVKDKLPDPVNKLVNFYVASQELPKVDIRLDPPKFARDFMKQFPPPHELQKFTGHFEDAAKNGGKRMIEEFKAEAQNQSLRLGEEAAAEGGKLIQRALRVVGEEADELIRAAPDITKVLVPTLKDGKIILGPVGEIDIPDLPPSTEGRGRVPGTSCDLVCKLGICYPEC